MRAFVLIAMIAPPFAFAQTAHEVGSSIVERDGVSIQATASPRVATVADVIMLRLEVRAPSGVEVEWPTALVIGGEIGGLTIVDVRELPSRIDVEGLLVESREYDLEPFLPGDASVGPFEFAIVRSGETDLAVVDAIAMRIDALLPEGDRGTLTGPKGVVDAPDREAAGWKPWIVGGSVALAIGAASATIVATRRLRTKPGASAKDLALASLAALDERVRGEAHVGRRPTNEEAYTELSSILRRYIEERFDYRATARTTEEFLRDASERRSSLPDDAASGLRGVMETCDEVKFGGAEPGMSAAGKAIDECRVFVCSFGDPEGEAHG